MIPEFIKRKGGAPSPPMVRGDKDRSRRGSAYLTVPGLTDKQGKHTFSSIYPGEDRPALMVTGCEVTINGKDYGLIVEAAVSFTCNTVAQFNSVQEILKPKSKLKINFGYTSFDPWGGAGAGNFEVTVYKYSFSLNANNQIECTVNGIGRGSGFKSFEVNRTIPSKRGQTLQLENATQAQTFDSILQAIRYPILNAFKKSFPDGIASLNEDSKSVPETGPVSGGVHLYFMPPKEKGTHSEGAGANTLEPLPMVELGTLLGWVNEILQEQNSEAVMKFDSLKTARVISGVCTANPSRIFFADAHTHGTWTQVNALTAHDTIDGEDTHGMIYIFQGAPVFTGDLTSQLLIGYELLYSMLTEVDNTKPKSESGVERRKPGNLTLEDFISKIGSAINDASGGVYDLRLVSNPEKETEFHLVDMSDAGAKAPSPTIYRPISGDGVTRSVEMTGEPDQDMINGALYSTGIKSGASDKSTGAPPNPKLAAAAGLAKTNLLTILKSAIEPKGPGFSDDVLGKIKAEVVSIVQGQDPASPEVRMSVPGPLNLGLTVDGNAKFKFGQIISADVVEGLANYKNVCFRVIEVKHTIKDNDWETKVSTVMDII